MQTSTSYQQIPSFHSKVYLEDTNTVYITSEHNIVVTPVLQRPEQDTLKAKVRQLARLQHLSVSALAASAHSGGILAVCLSVHSYIAGLDSRFASAPAQIAISTAQLSHTVWSPTKTVLSSWYRFAVTTSWGRCSWMMCGSAFCGMLQEALTPQMTADYTMMTSARHRPNH